MNVAQETLDFRRAELSSALSLLMSAFSLLIPPASLSAHLQQLTERSSTPHDLSHEAAASVGDFSPGTSSAQADSTSELLRFL